jgi:hypothetical protein
MLRVLQAAIFVSTASLMFSTNFAAAKPFVEQNGICPTNTTQYRVVQGAYLDQKNSSLAWKDLEGSSTQVMVPRSKCVIMHLTVDGYVSGSSGNGLNFKPIVNDRDVKCSPWQSAAFESTGVAVHGMFTLTYVCTDLDVGKSTFRFQFAAGQQGKQVAITRYTILFQYQK